MAAKIKLQRKGTKGRPFYRVVVQDESSPRDGRVVEVLGQYDPLKEHPIFDVNKEKTAAWLSKGAEPTEKVRILLGKAGLLPPIDLASLPKRRPRAELKAAAEAKEKGAPAEGEAKAEEKKEEAPKAEEKPAEVETPKEEAKAEAKVEEEQK
ncbi:MAG: 30S ribosomal protein S16 [Candidatus Margulisiibacteriota bacterium]